MNGALSGMQSIRRFQECLWSDLNTSYFCVEWVLNWSMKIDIFDNAYGSVYGGHLVYANDILVVIKEKQVTHLLKNFILKRPCNDWAIGCTRWSYHIVAGLVCQNTPACRGIFILKSSKSYLSS